MKSKEFKNILRELRKRNSLTQKELATALNVSEITDRSYEAGRREPSFDVIDKLEKYFDVTASYLYGNDDISIPKDEVEEEFTRVDLPTEYLSNRLYLLNNDLIHKKEQLKKMKIHNEFSDSKHHYITFVLEEEIEELEIVVDKLQKALE
jgi:transcriptional regulator with XRE-family HTH domain